MVHCSFGHTAEMPKFTGRSAKVSYIKGLTERGFHRLKYCPVAHNKPRNYSKLEHTLFTCLSSTEPSS